MSRRQSGNARAYVVGAGAVGGGLALWLADHGLLAGVCTRSSARAGALQEHLGLTVDVGAPGPVMAGAHVILVAVPDDAIVPTSEVIAKGAVHPSAVVAHTSGALAASVMARVGRPVASAHPLAVCPNQSVAHRVLPRSLFVLEGDAVATERVARLLTSCGARTAAIASAAKPKYHAAAVLASNLVVSLVDRAAALASDAGLPAVDAELLALALAALENQRELGLGAGITGPVARGDVNTVRLHLEALAGDARELYRLLTRHLAERVGSKLSKRQSEKLLDLLGPAAGTLPR